METVGYRTLRKIDGKSYIELKEHEDILGKVMDFKKALDEVKSTVGMITNSTKELGESLGNLMGA